MMKKVVVKLEVNNEKSKKKAMKTVSNISGVDSVSMDMEDKKLTVTGNVDPLGIVQKLSKSLTPKIESVESFEPVKKKKVEPILCLSQKVVVKLDVNDEKSKTKAMNIVSNAGVNSVSMDMEYKKLTITGNVDLVGIVKKLRKKSFSPDLESVEPENKKNVEPRKEVEQVKKKEEPNKKEKKEEPKKLEEKKKH